MCDVTSPFCPLPRSSLLFNLAAQRDKLEAILNMIELLYEGKDGTSGSLKSAGGSAIKAGIDALKGCIGKVLWFCVDIPSLGYGRLTNRNNPQLYGTDKERQLYNQSNAYKELLDTCRAEKFGINVFACGSKEMDLASLRAFASTTGGELYYYPHFTSSAYSCPHNSAGEKLHYDLHRNLTRLAVYNVLLRARCSVGLEVSKYLGGFGDSVESVVRVSCMNADQSMGFLMRQRNKLKVDGLAYVQFAVLYTMATGESRTRVFNYAFRVTDSLSTG
eukprot:TRINITY_DN5452_c0_g1_i2.p2 TRINITY_DN5452_c0_g1~~TRINITY_DN5452_c0_g1_i2.p2  ORF type:complete len:275 (+),score=42.46 TRINITY_DN5452_c0_g1_i2:866-1690(+)